MINLDNVDRPAILAEVTAAFYQYEEALVSNNIEALDALFWHDPRTVRLADCRRPGQSDGLSRVYGSGPETKVSTGPLPVR